MLCPNPSCAAITPHPTLTLSERQGIEIDYCPTCRGVWLDRGELDKLIERATAEIQPALVSQPRAPEPPPRHESHYKDPYKDHYKHSHKEYYNKDYYKGHYGHRKKSLLGELFDF
jgi:Zn-finger nucleic acid-binding protein